MGLRVHRVWETPIALVAGGHTLSFTLHRWINDGLMATFFLLVGLEIKHQAVAGELATPRQAALPIAAAVGGMIVPAAIYVLTNGGGSQTARGWAIPMATDIAFALGVLALVAPRAPKRTQGLSGGACHRGRYGGRAGDCPLYTGAIAWSALGIAGLFLLALIALNLLGFTRLAPYLVLGLGLWLFVHASGVHATIAGVLVALTIPTRTPINAPHFSAKAHDLLGDFDRTETGDFLVMTSRGQQEAIFGLARASKQVTAPLLRLEHALHGFSAFVVMPLFAFSNAGVDLSGSPASSVTLAVVLGLLVGKPLGITAAALAAVRLRVAAFQRASVGRRSTDAPGWVALGSRCHCSLRRWHSKTRRRSTRPRSGFWAGRCWPAWWGLSLCEPARVPEKRGRLEVAHRVSPPFHREAHHERQDVPVQEEVALPCQLAEATHDRPRGGERRDLVDSFLPRSAGTRR